jgi:hypothetical protein
LTEVIGEVLFELVFGFGWDYLTPREDKSGSVFAAVSQFLFGAAAGVLSVLILPTRVVSRPFVPGISLAISPIVTGIAMQRVGDFWRDRGKSAPALFSFRGGAIFAFGMALARFVLIELEWRPF